MGDQQSHPTNASHPSHSFYPSPAKKTRDRVRKKVNPLHKNKTKTSGPLYMRNGDIPPPPKRTPPAVPATVSKKSKSARNLRNGKKAKNGTPSNSKSSKQSKGSQKGTEDNDGWITVKGSSNDSNPLKERVLEAMKENV